MNLRVTFEAITKGPELSWWRRAYTNSLPEPHAPLLSALSETAQFYLVRGRQGPCGYLALAADRTLIELYLDEAHWVFGEAVAKQALRRLSIRRALVQQYDSLLLSSLIAHQRSVRSMGLLVRDHVERLLPRLPGMELASRTAAPADLPAIMAIDQQVFVHPDRMRAVVAAGHVRLYERDDALIGFGIMRPVGDDGAVEVGIAVDPPFRARGHAVYMLEAMVQHCHARGLRPIAGCAEDNKASRNMGERVGFVARYRLLELTF